MLPINHQFSESLTMSQTHRNVSESVFWFQMFIIVAFFIPFQAHRMFYNTDGVILTSFLFVAIYSGFMLSLSLSAYRASPSRLTRQMVAVWVLGVALYALFTTIFFFKAERLWNPNDTVNSVYAFIGIIGATALVIIRKLPLKHPEVRMSLALSFRVIPQLLLGLNAFASQSAKGLSGWFVWSFHVLIACRIIQAYLGMKEQKQKGHVDQSMRYMLISELLGWATWWVITAAWIMY
jgi:hypothetical protein